MKATKDQIPAEPPAEKKKKKREHKEHECPFCHKMVRNLPNHIRIIHPTEHNPKAAPPALTAAQLTGKEKIPPAEDNSQPVYACAACKGELRMDEITCWNCGATLDWKEIKGA